MSWKDDDCKHCAAATATLERVREVRNRMRNTGTIWGDELEAALAGQPEAPQCHAYVTGNPIDCGGCEEHVGQREATTLEANASLPPKRPLEAPKGQEHTEHDLETVVAAVETILTKYELSHDDTNDYVESIMRVVWCQKEGDYERKQYVSTLQRALAAANARIAELKELAAALIAANEAGCESLSAANARIAELEAAAEAMHERGYEQLREAREARFRAEGESERNAQRFHELTLKHYATANERNAAKARIAELESWGLQSLRDAVKAANARADAAEREVNRLYRERVIPAETERDQLAARVKELEQKARDLRDGNEFLSRELGRQACTPEERAVLDACEGLVFEQTRPDVIYCGYVAVGKAELANRAAKAGKGTGQ
jgi:hypothetical protein